ncbi:MAG: Vms1/Ankzf1 family peptidyl-tRNA hydrolase [Halobacteriota archaeon]
MLDTLLGRASLKEELERLRAELERCRDARERLEARLESADDRRREAVRQRQEAQERLNHLEDRIAQLEDELERTGEADAVHGRGQSTRSRRRIEPVLELLTSVETGPEEAFTAMIEGEPPTAVREHLTERSALVDRVAPCLCLFDADGLIEVALEPPRPPAPFEGWADRFVLERRWFLPEEALAFALVRSDVFAVGRVVDGELTDVEGFEADVMGRHSKGGFSQARFERRREEQIDRHVDRVDDRLAAYLGDEPLVLTGSRTVLDRLDVEAVAREPVDASGDPSDALSTAFEAFWTTTVHRL